MGDIKDLSGSEALAKIKELAQDKICLFCTYAGGAIVSRPMSTQQVDDNGTLWFFSNRDSIKNLQIEDNSTVYLMYSDTGKNQYLSLSGQASITTDRSKIEALWNPVAKAWFEEGKNDPELTLIAVKPVDGHYWDTKNGKLISFIKIAVAAVTGNEMDGSVEGDLNL